MTFIQDLLENVIIPHIDPVQRMQLKEGGSKFYTNEIITVTLYAQQLLEKHAEVYIKKKYPERKIVDHGDPERLQKDIDKEWERVKKVQETRRQVNRFALRLLLDQLSLKLQNC